MNENRLGRLSLNVTSSRLGGATNAVREREREREREVFLDDQHVTESR
jgi:hypothetical protein